MLGNWEDLLMGFSFAGAVLVGMAMHNIQTPELTSVALAAENGAAEIVQATPESPRLSFTVTGKRMPKECKGEPASAEIAARCEAIRDATRVEVKSNQ